MKRFKNILVATDTRLDNQSIIDEAAKLAKESDASLKLVDVVPPLPWTTRLLLSNHEHMSGLMIREKQEQLEKLAAPIRDEGIDVETKVLNGKSSVEIIREVLRDKHDLVMRVAKGSDSRRKGFFGTTGTRLLRECPCAVHLVAPGSSTLVQQVLACVDTSTGDAVDAELNDNIIDLAVTVNRVVEVPPSRPNHLPARSATPVSRIAPPTTKSPAIIRTNELENPAVASAGVRMPVSKSGR